MPFAIKIAEPGRPVAYLHTFNTMGYQVGTVAEESAALKFEYWGDAEETVDVAFEHPTPKWVTIVDLLGDGIEAVEHAMKTEGGSLKTWNRAANLAQNTVHSTADRMSALRLIYKIIGEPMPEGSDEQILTDYVNSVREMFGRSPK